MTPTDPRRRPRRLDNDGPERVCSRCREPRPLEAFRRDSRGYLRSHCNPCALAVTREWRAAHRDELLEPMRIGYSQTQRARMLGVERQTIQNWDADSLVAKDLSTRPDGPTHADDGRGRAQPLRKPGAAR